MTELAYQCKPCGKVFEDEGRCRSHASSHRTKPYMNQTGSKKVPAGGMVREVRVERSETEGVTLHQVSGQSPPENGDTEYLVKNDPPETKKTRLWEYGGNE